jgi:hypothetical protein
MPWPKGKPRGHRPPGAGRKKGTRNKGNQKREAEIAASGLTPLEFMLNVLRDPKRSRESRMMAAIQAAPYVHPKLASTQLSTPPGRPFETTQLPAQPELIGSYLERLAQMSADRPARRTAKGVGKAPIPDHDGGEGDLPD